MSAAEPDLSSLLQAFQLPDPNIYDSFDEVVRPILRRMAAAHSYGLPKDVLDEVVQEAFLSLYNPNLQRFNLATSTANQYLLGRVLNAVKTTQISHGLRRSGSDFDNEPQREFVPLEDANLTSTMGVPLEAIQARQTVQRIFAKIDGGMQTAIMRVYGEDESQEAVAADMKISRFALGRKLSGVKIAALQMMAAA